MTLLNLMLSLFPIALGFASGPVIMPEGGGNASPGVVPEIEPTSPEPVSEEPTRELPEEPELPEAPKPEDKVTAADIIDWRQVPNDVKNHINELAKSNPKLANMVQNAVYTSQTFLREFPQGLKEAQDLKRTIDEAGGVEEINNLRGIHQSLVDEQELMDNQARTGDPAILDNFMEVAGDGFNKLMPAALDKWLAKDPDMYSHVLGKIMVNSLTEAGIVSNFNMALKMLALNNEEATKVAMDALREAANWMNGLNKIATTVPTKPQADPRIAEQQQQIDNEKAQIFNEKFSNQFGAWRNREIRQQLDTIAPRRNLSDYQRATFGQKVVDEMKEILTADQEYMKNLERIYNSKDMDALLRFTKSRNAKLLPDVTRKVYRQLFSSGGLGTKKPQVADGSGVGFEPTSTQGGAGGNGRAPVQPTLPKGWVRVEPERAPRPDEIDNVKTDFKMKYNKSAVLKSGRKVYWGAKVPTD